MKYFNVCTTQNLYRATVFLTGAAVLIIEVTGVRMLSPRFGSSLHVLSSVLTVILAALAYGYRVGGRWADTNPSQSRLYRIIIVSGIAVLGSEAVALSALPYAQDMIGSLVGPLVYSGILFFAPAFFLGIVSPYMVKLETMASEGDRAGTIAGSIFFWGTFGSIMGSLLTGYVFMPFFGIKAIMLGTGLGLVALGLCGQFYTERKKLLAFINGRAYILLGVFLFVAVLVSFIVHDEYRYPFPILYREDGLYSQILVYEKKFHDHLIHALRRDTNNSSSTYMDSYDLVYEYNQFSEFYDVLKPDTKRTLIIGGGAYSSPRTLVARNSEMHVDVVETEPRLYDIAKQYFDVPDTERLTNFVIDGRVFLAQNQNPYDLIFLDAFGTDLGVPAHLVTKEFFETVRKNLTTEGILLVNFVGMLGGEEPTLTGSFIKTLYSVFPNMEVYAVNTIRVDEMQNIVLVARNGEEPIVLDEKYLVELSGRKKQVKDLQIETDVFLGERELVFTDDRVPAEYLMNKQIRRMSRL